MTHFFKTISGFILLTLIQFTVLDYLSLSHYIDLILIALFLCLLSSRTKYLYLSALISGLLFDLFSGYPLGTKTFLYLLFVFILISIRKSFLRNIGPGSFLVFLALSFSLFEIAKVFFFIALGLKASFSLLILTRIFANGFVTTLFAFLGRKKLFKDSS